MNPNIHHDKQESIREPPTTLFGILKELGPGLIIAGSIVGSGELIATTLTGAESGFWFLWLILIGCVIKVFTQLEIGKFTISTGKTTLEGLSMLPGFKLAGIHWIVWLWVITFLASLGQAGGIVGSIGQCFSIALPLTETRKEYNEAADALVTKQLRLSLENNNESAAELAGAGEPSEAGPGKALEALPREGPDVYYWAIIISVVTSFLLVRGGYRRIERIVFPLVASFTALSIVNFILLQLNAAWAVSAADVLKGLRFQLPPARPGLTPLVTALATFGMIGLGAGELIFYPYWCQEKGYGKYVGPRDDSKAWLERAEGWIRVMRWDAWCSMLVYTFSTIVFYLLGASVLNKAGLHPHGSELIRILCAMFEPVFGAWAVGLFLVGSIIILYSTFFVGSASNALVFSDALTLFGHDRKWSMTRESMRPAIGFALPIIACGMLFLFPKPTVLILIAGATQTLLLPVLAFSALYFRYKVTDENLGSGWMWDGCLWVSSVTLFLIGAWLVVSVMVPLITKG